jgi:hypothetical protein
VRAGGPHAAGGAYSRLAELGHASARFTETIVLRAPSSEEADFLRLSDEQHVLTIFHIAWTSDEWPVEVTIPRAATASVGSALRLAGGAIGTLVLQLRLGVRASAAAR